MVSINYATREVSCKIVYYGPGLSGKTTNLQYVHKKVPSETKGKLISLATDADRTLYFDFLPINIGSINGFQAKFQLYTVPGQVYYNATRKLVLRGVDGLVFVADSQRDKMDENIESLNNLRENLAEYGYKADEMPIVIQYNKQDLPGVMTPEEIRPILNTQGWPEFKASATEGFGVFDTLKYILKMVLDHARKGGAVPSSTAGEQPAAPAQTVPQAPVSTPATPVPPVAAPAPEDAQPVPQPVMAGPATAAPQQPQPSVPSIAASSEPVRETVTPSPQPALEQVSMETAEVARRPKYRPFPGNSWEDEQEVISEENHDVVAPQTDYDREAETDMNTQPAGAPRMEPSLKASEKPKKKKRSFFRRLFGLE